MSELKEKVVFLQGLAQGMEVDETTKEGKLLKSILDILADMADEMPDMSADLDEIYDYVDELDADLAEIEEEVYGDEDDDCCCHHHHHDDDECDCDDDDCCCEDEEDYVEVTCPNCHETVCFSSDILEADEPIEVVCPVCDAAVFSNDAEYVEVEDETKQSEDEDK